MRERIKGIARFAAFEVCVVLLIHWIDRTVVAKYMYDNMEPQTLTYEGFYNMKKDSVDVLILGTSQAASGINPQDLYDTRQIRAYNLASSAQQVWLSYYWLKEALKYQKPSAVIFECNYLFEERNFKEAARKSLDYMRWGPTKAEAVRASVERDTTHQENMISYVFPFIRFHERWMDLNEWDLNWAEYSKEPSLLKGFWFYDWHGTNDKYELFAEKSADPSDDALKEVSMADFEKIYELCRDNGIQLILVKTPYHIFTKARHNEVAAWAEKNAVPFIDFNDEELFRKIGFNYHAEDINDVGEFNGHVNYSGSRKMSCYLADFIADNHYAESTFDEQWENSKAFNEAMYHNFELTGTDELEKYLGMLGEERYTVIITARKAQKRVLSDQAVERLCELGLDETLCRGLQENSGSNYLAIIDRGKVFREVLSEKDIDYLDSIRDGLVRLRTALYGTDTSGWGAIEFDDSEKMKGNDGLNIVVYDNDRRCVIDSVNFAIESPEAAITR